MREIVLGTAGHVDHGKTSFIRALTGFETDRLKEEQKRGITIELGFAYLDLPCGHRIGIVDVPGHEKFVKTMVSGVSGIDILAFIVAADEGIMPQTVEHFEICRLMGVEQGIIIVTKKDMVDPDWLEMVNEEIQEFCADSFLEGAPIINVSSTTGEGIEEVRDEINKIVAGFSFHEVFGPFRLSVDRIFAIKGFGAVVTGTSISGRTAVGEDLRIYPTERRAKIRGIQVHSSAVDEVEAGHRTAINLQGVSKSEIERGMVLAPDNTLQASYMLDCQFFYLASNPKPLKHRSRVRVHVGTAEIIGRISLLDRDEVQPGEEVPVQVLLEEKAVVWPEDRFVIRSYSPVATIGGGVILGNVSPRKRKRLLDGDRQYNLEMYQKLKDGSVEDKILFLLKESRELGLTADEVGIRLGLFGKHLKKALQDPISTKKMVVVDSATQRYVVAEIAENIKQLFVNYLTQYHKTNPLLQGLAKEELRTSLGREIDQKVYSYCLNELIRKGVVIQEESIVRMADHEVALKADEEQLRKDLDAWFIQRGLSTPTIKETMEHFEEYPGKLVKEVINLDIRDGKIIKVSESLYYSKRILDPLIDSVKKHIETNGEIDAPAFKELTGLTRKFSIPILEYLDREKITMRIGDKRILRKKVS
ncbi:selenocysteine-specific translation elongation factor [Desulforhopalus sp. IMCC35007]|uniref:selenocysteine-specific translation elongation factor n=1 Tax=Desulforhopalus sp. IMCC35007 TaxID=2569543 RepID=UPI0010AECE16|nr:selenocysteine-specific translation elongation factor [Desulforhopalus sp. IMCC35007]TKB09400.1 selenocysteine-specific translation elongation factor [Desulforhopalus sp. IMCC35007]